MPPDTFVTAATKKFLNKETLFSGINHEEFLGMTKIRT